MARAISHRGHRSRTNILVLWSPGSTPEPDSGIADFYLEHYEMSSQTIGRQIAFVVRKPVLRYEAAENVNLCSLEKAQR